ncbi:MAG: CIA30 family protein [Planctomycetota bacterium]
MTTLIDFSHPEEAQRWSPVDDAVMGGSSNSRLQHTESGHALFAGEVSTENNGGFASVRTSGEHCAMPGATAVRLRVRGDGHDYRLRLRSSLEVEAPSWMRTFSTIPNQWIDIDLSFDDFRYEWRGRPVANAPALVPAEICGLGLVLASKEEGPFRLELASLGWR